MKRLASEVLRDLEVRVARLEKQSTSASFPLGRDIQRAIDRKDYEEVLFLLGELKQDLILQSSHPDTNQRKMGEMIRLLDDTIRAVELFLKKRSKIQKNMKSLTQSIETSEIKLTDLRSNLAKFQTIVDGTLQEMVDSWVSPYNLKRVARLEKQSDLRFQSEDDMVLNVVHAHSYRKNSRGIMWPEVHHLLRFCISNKQAVKQSIERLVKKGLINYEGPNTNRYSMDEAQIQMFEDQFQPFTYRG